MLRSSRSAAGSLCRSEDPQVQHSEHPQKNPQAAFTILFLLLEFSQLWSGLEVIWSTFQGSGKIKQLQGNPRDIPDTHPQLLHTQGCVPGAARVK